MNRKNNYTKHSKPATWAMITLVCVGSALLSATLCVHISAMGRAACGLVGAILVLSFAASVVGASVVGEIMGQLRRSKFGESSQRASDQRPLLPQTEKAAQKTKLN
jgi:hypothetical protein